MFKFKASAATDIGRRANNEDAFLSRPEAGVFALSDGMGGPPAGEVASAIFVESAAAVAARAKPAATINEARDLIQSAFHLAHCSLAEHVAKYADHEGMGCTAELLVFRGDHYLLGHLGDSRVYQHREGKLRQLTTDHSLVQQMVQQGLVPPDQARRHPMRNILTRTLVADLEPSIDVSRGSVRPGDIYLLCSDGLTEALDDAAIAEILAAGEDLAGKLELLMQRARSAGGSDNVTVVLCEVEAA